MRSFKDYWNALNPSDRIHLAKQLNTSVDQLKMVAVGRVVSIPFALRLYQQCHEQFDFLSLQFNEAIHWNVLFDILNRSKAHFPQSATAQ